LVDRLVNWEISKSVGSDWQRPPSMTVPSFKCATPKYIISHVPTQAMASTTVPHVYQIYQSSILGIILIYLGSTKYNISSAARYPGAKLKPFKTKTRQGLRALRSLLSLANVRLSLPLSRSPALPLPLSLCKPCVSPEAAAQSIKMDLFVFHAGSHGR
jgi:hypothetical protein